MSAPAEGTLQRVATFLAAFGIGVAAYIVIAEADGGAPACLAGGSGCERVAASSHSELLGISVALIGIFGYALLLGAALLRGDGPRMAGFALALTGFGYSVYLTYLELFMIEAVCQWCLVSAVLMTLLFALNAVRMVAYVGRPS
ncbi:MAG TPA: vitamin K epoxide reductase family protein [Solirubrobacterales bacterium]|nr:vitamin K epoxide reductase family protein [Solirubrobacterales bacterium]